MVPRCNCRLLQFLRLPFGAAAGIKYGCGRVASLVAAQPESAHAAGGASRLPKKPAQATLDFQPVLTEEQTRVVSRARSGENLFITGAAGTGKSFLLRCVITELRKMNVGRDDARVAVTAPTGIAALNVGGVTIHSFAGIGLGQGTASELIGRVIGNKRSRENWLKSRVLVIDEVSMLSSDLFEMLDDIAREVRGDSQPFGGKNGARQ
jgi:DNA replication protein DnaC